MSEQGDGLDQCLGGYLHSFNHVLGGIVQIYHHSGYLDLDEL